MPTPAKHPSTRRRANRRPSAAELAAPAEPQGLELPASYVVGFTEHGPIERDYADRTRRWWDRLRVSPMATAFEPIHWEWLLLLAPLFDRWAALGDLDALKELRLQAKPFGLRPSDANALDWTIDPTVSGPAPAPVVEEPPPSRTRLRGRRVAPLRRRRPGPRARRRREARRHHRRRRRPPARPALTAGPPADRLRRRSARMSDHPDDDLQLQAEYVAARTYASILAVQDAAAEHFTDPAERERFLATFVRHQHARMLAAQQMLSPSDDDLDPEARGW